MTFGLRHDSVTSREESWPVSDSPQDSESSSPAEHSVSTPFFSEDTTMSNATRAGMSNIAGNAMPRDATTTLSHLHDGLGWHTSPDEEDVTISVNERFSNTWSLDQTRNDPIQETGDQEQEDRSHIKHGLDLYFSSFASSLPFIHQATFDSGTVAECLSLAMLAIGLHHDQTAERTNKAIHFYDRALTCLDRINDEELRTVADALVVVQSLLLLEVYAILFLCGEHSATGLKLHARIIAISRSAKLLSCDQQQEPTGRDLNAVWQGFVFSESHKRTMLAVHQVDALWYHFLSVPRSLSHLEIKHKLPCAVDEWMASTAAEWAYSRLTSCSRSILSNTTYPDVIRSLLAPKSLLPDSRHDLVGCDQFGITNFAHFALSSIREISGWSTITGCVSMDRVEPLKAALLSVAPLAQTDATLSSRIFRATWEMAVIDLHIWSLSHTGGVVHSSIDTALRHATELAIEGDLVLNAEIVATIRPHVDWFLQFLEGDAADPNDDDPPWVLLFAYKVFLLAWQCLRQGFSNIMDVVVARYHDGSSGGATHATRWARMVMERRHRHKWRYVHIISRCLDALEAVS